MFIAFLACSSLDCYEAEARPLASISTLMARLKLEGESPNCWDSLVQLQACSGEIILFFLNEGQILEGYCEQAADSTTPSPSAPSVVPLKVVPNQTLVP
ncbi:unnamed protein product [Dovyalis caffra]|uniref:Prolamin-like domain-containing protein n=1 Tax=Dovyalis caffra TaxID=77055 RepID=A0AAV1SIM6_9ROSI|nr:unnamed protein product [Dovyalis caffra]